MFSRVAFSGCVVFVGLAALSGCAGDPDTIYAQSLGIECSRAEGWVADQACTVRPAGQGVEQVSRYCYATIGSANCFDRPDSDRKNQQLGSSGY